MNATTSLPSTMVEMAANPEEVAAAKVALEGTTAQRLRVGLRALRNLMKNPEDTEQVFVLGVAVNAHRFPLMMARFAIEPGGIELLHDRPALDSHTIDFAALEKLPANTLGYAFARHMKDNQLSPDLFQAPPGLPPAAAYVAQRIRQTHDIWHVLTGYPTDVPGELALQAFYWAHLGSTSSMLISTLGTLRYLGKFRKRGIVKMVRDGYRRGKHLLAYLPTVKWEELWSVPLAEVQRRFNIPPAAL